MRRRRTSAAALTAGLASLLTTAASTGAVAAPTSVDTVAGAAPVRAFVRVDQVGYAPGETKQAYVLTFASAATSSMALQIRSPTISSRTPPLVEGTW